MPIIGKERKGSTYSKAAKAYQQRELAHPIKGKAQEREKRLRRTEKKEAVHVAKP